MGPIGFYYYFIELIDIIIILTKEYRFINKVFRNTRRDGSFWIPSTGVNIAGGFKGLAWHAGYNLGIPSVCDVKLNVPKSNEIQL